MSVEQTYSKVGAVGANGPTSAGKSLKASGMVSSVVGETVVPVSFSKVDHRRSTQLEHW